MAVRIRQMNIAYVPVQDRLLFRVNTTENSEYRLWFTRHFLRALWPEIVKVLSADPQIQSLDDNEQKEAVLSFKHETAVSQSNFSRKYDDNVVQRPLGVSPLLVSTLRIKTTAPGSIILAFQNARAGGVELSMEQNLLHSFCQLLIDTVNKAQWDLDLRIVRTAVAEYNENRVLN